MDNCQFATKIRLVLALVIAGFFVMAARLVELQLLGATHYQQLAQNNRRSRERLPPERGAILDRYGGVIAANTKAFFIKEQDGKSHRVSTEEALPLLASGSAEVAYELERHYPFPHSLAQSLGYVGLVTADDLTTRSDLTPKDRVGKIGLEKVFDRYLQGEAGFMNYEVTARGKRVRSLGKTTGKPGGMLQTTIDPYLSEVAYRLMSGKKGAVVILDAKNSEVLSLVSTPSFSASDLSSSSSKFAAEEERTKRVTAYFSDPNQVFFNRATTGLYPPGSVFKLVTAAVGLEKEAVTAETVVADSGTLKVGEFEYANWYYTQYGRTEGEVAVERALARSNDIFFYKTAEWLGPFALAEAARSFGFGDKTNLELTAEAAGIVPDPDWKQRTLGEQWFLGNTYHFGIGQGDLLVTPLQIAQMTQAVGNRGLLCPPRLIDTKLHKKLTNTETHCRETGIQEKNLELVLSGMLAACSSGGTAYPFFAFNEQQKKELPSFYAQMNQGMAACKTGTAEFGGQDGRGYRKTHGWFSLVLGIDQAIISGFGEKSKKMQPVQQLPLVTAESSNRELHEAWVGALSHKSFPKEVVVVVLVESDETTPYREGSRDAAPIARALIEWIYTGSTTSIVESAQNSSYQGE